MNRIITDHASGQAFHPSLIQSMYRLRDRVFRERLGWDVTSIDGKEKDSYDDLNPVYMMSCNYKKQLEGCWRLLPTTGPNMLKDVFPQLLRGEALPNDPQIWEISRLAVEPYIKHSIIKGNVNEVTFGLFRQIYDHGVQNNIKSYVAVTSAAMERMLRMAGIPIRRFGDGKLTRIGKVMSLCIWIDVDDQLRDALYGPFMNEKEAA